MNAEEEREFGDLAALVEFMALQPGMVETVLAVHVADRGGSCAGCGGQLRVRWPCVHHKCAVAAGAVRARRTAGRPAPRR